MKEHPILFNTVMVEAILDGRKTQTRRIVSDEKSVNGVYTNVKCSITDLGLMVHFKNADHQCESFAGYKNPFGQVGDLIYVRETHAFYRGAILFKAGNENNVLKCSKWKPSLHMPKNYARIWLEITDIGVERVNMISESDAKAEGLKNDGLKVECPVCDNIGHNGADIICEDGFFYTNYSAFKALWNSLYSKPKADVSKCWIDGKLRSATVGYHCFPFDDKSPNHGLDSQRNLPVTAITNPWVWVIKFKVLSTTGKSNIPSIQ